LKRIRHFQSSGRISQGWNNRRRVDFVAGVVNVSGVVFTLPFIHFAEHAFDQVEVWDAAVGNSARRQRRGAPPA
jgi:hypothetical protein